MSLNILLDKNLDSMIEMNNDIETNGMKRYDNQSQTKDEIDWIIEQHSRNLERIKETLKVY